MHRFALGLGGAAQAFSVNCKDGKIALPLVLLKPGTSDFVQYLRIHCLEQTTNSRFTGGDEFAAFAIFAGTEGTQPGLIEGLRESADAAESVDAHEHGSGGNG